MTTEIPAHVVDLARALDARIEEGPAATLGEWIERLERDGRVEDVRAALWETMDEKADDTSACTEYERHAREHGHMGRPHMLEAEYTVQRTVTRTYIQTVTVTARDEDDALIEADNEAWPDEDEQDEDTGDWEVTDEHHNLGEVEDTPALADLVRALCSYTENPTSGFAEVAAAGLAYLKAEGCPLTSAVSVGYSTSAVRVLYATRQGVEWPEVEGLKDGMTALMSSGLVTQPRYRMVTSANGTMRPQDYGYRVDVDDPYSANTRENVRAAVTAHLNNQAREQWTDGNPYNAPQFDVGSSSLNYSVATAWSVAE